MTAMETNFCRLRTRLSSLNLAAWINELSVRLTMRDISLKSISLDHEIEIDDVAGPG